MSDLIPWPAAGYAGDFFHVVGGAFMKTIINFWIRPAYAPGKVPVNSCRYFKKKKSKPGCMNFAEYPGTSTWVLVRHIAVPVPVNRQFMGPFGPIKIGPGLMG